MKRVSMRATYRCPFATPRSGCTASPWLLLQSKGIFACLSCDKGLSAFLKGHDEAFSHFGAVPRQIWYEPSSLVVRTRHNRTTIRESLAKYASIQGFVPRLVPIGPYRFFTKAERTILYVRHVGESREWSSLEELNRAIRNHAQIS